MNCVYYRLLQSLGRNNFQDSEKFFSDLSLSCCFFSNIFERTSEVVYNRSPNNDAYDIRNGKYFLPITTGEEN
jgi:hypothetical protein